MEERRHGYLEFDNRLREIELQLGRLSSHVESEQGNYTRIFDEHNERLKDIQICLAGNNGSSGLRIDVDRLKETSKSQEKNWRILVASVVGLGVNALWNWITKKL